MAESKKDENRVNTMTGVSSTSETVSGKVYIAGITPVNIAINPVTHAMKVEEA